MAQGRLEDGLTLLEVNYDGLVGPTHNYAGLSRGNVASQTHGGQESNPRKAALQGLEKMRLLVRLGLRQGLIPPQARPSLRSLRALGFSGSDARVIESAGKSDPSLLAASYSASSMWAANAATVAPSTDTLDGRVHFTPASLISTFHRSLEARETARMLRRLFGDGGCFVHHEPLPAHPRFGDEGAANHTRLGSATMPGVHLFVYGSGVPGRPAPEKHPARQTLEASQAVARLLGLSPGRVVYAQQSPAAIDAGVFHNDVIAVGHRDFLWMHEDAYVEQDVGEGLRAVLDWQLRVEVVPRARISMERAVATYLFNSQLVDVGGELHLVAPQECADDDVVRAYLDELVDSHAPLRKVHYLDVRESMRNGGGPACLRLRVPLTEREWQHTHPSTRLEQSTLDLLEAWVTRHYRDRLLPGDLHDPLLRIETQTALDELTDLLELGSDFYPFQRVRSRDR